MLKTRSFELEKIDAIEYYKKEKKRKKVDI
jgi:hypothetical protein